MLFLQILAFLASFFIGVWLVGVFLVSAININAKSVGFGNMILGIPALALAGWLPFAFGWIVV